MLLIICSCVIASEEFLSLNEDHATLIIELCKNASQMFKSGNVAKKRRVIDMITSNCIYKDGNIDIEFKPVFQVVLQSAGTRNWCAQKESNL